MNHFLLVYDRSVGKLTEEPREYAEAQRDQATSDRLARELLEREHPQIEVILLGADSLDALMATHTRYFGGMDKRLLATFA